MDKIMPEPIVLIETAKWFVKKGYILSSVSIPRGKGHTGDTKSILEREIADIGYDKEINYSPTGADIIAQNKDEIWKVECKGLGSGTSQTLRNNFDRALASVITYFDSEEKNQFLALAIPNAPSYLQQLSRISKPLRKALNLWILLLDESDKVVSEYKPDDDIEGVIGKKHGYADIKEVLKDPDFRKKIQELLKSTK